MVSETLQDLFLGNMWNCGELWGIAKIPEYRPKAQFWLPCVIGEHFLLDMHNY